MRLNHWSPVAIRKLAARVHPQTATFKPVGFWFDVGGDWKRWCLHAKYHPENLTWRHTVKLTDPARVLHLSGEEEIDDFTTGFACPILPDMPFWKHTAAINWPLVAEQYAGIIIEPYCWLKRHEYVWYYPWDCASGCVWDLSVITLGKPQRRIRNSRISKTSKK